MAAEAARPQLVGVVTVRRRMSIELSCYLILVTTLSTLTRTCVAINELCPSSCSCLGIFVDCSKRGLIEVPRDLPVWAENIELQVNDITSIPEEAFRGLANLKQLDISFNKIRSLNSSSFIGLNALTDLKINDNILNEMPNLGDLPNLQNLFLNRNNINSIPGTSLEGLPSLFHLELNSNRISELTNTSFPNASSKLQTLSLNSNRILRLEKGVFKNLTSLERLKLNKNHIKVLQKDLFRNLTNLESLELNRNQLTHIHGLVFQNLNSLQILKLKRNNISQLFDGCFWGLNNIKNLHLDYNNLTFITKGWLYGLNSLEQLTASHNQISKMDGDGWEYCKGLSELDLTFNELDAINKDNFSRLQNLRYLHLDNNKISFVEEGAFKSLRSLQVLNLKNNDISWSIEDTNGAFTGLDRLTKLGLSNNKIKSIAKKAFAGLNKLRILDLSLNPVTSIQENPFFKLKHLQTLSLDSHNLLCDCSLKWFTIWIMHSRINYDGSAKCGHPMWMKGIPIMKAKPENFTCDDFPKPYIIEEPKTGIALKGANVTLVCRGAISSSAASDTTFRWRKDNKLLLDGNNVDTYGELKEGGVTEYVSLLHLRNIQDEDEGHYQCIISNHLGSVYSQKANITVHVFPVFTKTPSNVTVKAGSTARLECAVEGQPAPEIAWQKDGGDDFPAARERRMHVMPSDDVFFIVGVKLSDMGVYSCTAKNAAGTIVANATLQVQEIPSFVKPMEDKQTIAGETAVLECMASGSPKPRLNWTKDGGPLIPTERHFFTAEGQLLIIVQTQPSDTGRYVCEMTNALGSERDSASLKVSPASSSSNSLAAGVEDGATTGIIIIAVVCCVVGTSLVWVVIIYQTRKRSEDYAQTQNDDSTLANGELAPFHHPGYPSAGSAIVDFKDSARHLFSDSNSEHSSKDSGTGESAKQSNDELLSCEEPDIHCHRLLISNRNNVGNGVGGPYGGSPIMKRPSVSSMLGQRSDMSDELSGHTTCDSQSPLLHTFQPGIHSVDKRVRQMPTSRPSWASKGNNNVGYYSHPQAPADGHFPERNMDDQGEAEVNRWSCDPSHLSPVPYKPDARPSNSHLASQRCFSAEQLTALDLGANLESEMARLRLEMTSSRSSDAVTPSGRSSAYPRSLSLATWSMGSLQTGQQDVPNDSGSFSIVSSETLPTSPRSVSRRTLFHTEPEGRSTSAPMSTIDCEKNCERKELEAKNEYLDTYRTIVPSSRQDRYSPVAGNVEVT